MRHIDCTTLYLPIIARNLVIRPSPYAQCISCVSDEDGLIAGAIYDDFNPLSVTAGIWIAEGKVPSRDWYTAIFDYPFNRLRVDKIVGQVVGSNTKAQKLDSHLGFKEAARIPDYSPEGDLVFYTMYRQDCKILNSPRWARVVDKVMRAA